MKTSIGWTDISVNPALARKPDGTLGFHCRKVSPGCLHCYAETFNLRKLPARGTGLGYVAGSAKEVEIVLHQPALDEVAKLRNPTRIFWCSMTDLFGGFVPWEIQQAVLDAAAAAAEAGHTSLILTKRTLAAGGAIMHWSERHRRPMPWGVHLGFSAEDQPRFDERWSDWRLMARYTEGPLWCSYEPALARVDFASGLSTDGSPHLGWIVVGFESGGGARPGELSWVRSLLGDVILTRRRQSGPTALYVKQLGRVWAQRRRYLGLPIFRQGDAKAEDPRWWPQDLRVRQFPRRPI